MKKVVGKRKKSGSKDEKSGSKRLKNRNRPFLLRMDEWGGVASQAREARVGAPAIWPQKPAHRDSKTAMNGAQLLTAHSDSSGSMSGPPAIGDRGFSGPQSGSWDTRPT
jgi:hypothetical protein